MKQAGSSPSVTDWTKLIVFYKTMGLQYDEKTSIVAMWMGMNLVNFKVLKWMVHKVEEITSS